MQAVATSNFTFFNRLLVLSENPALTKAITSVVHIVRLGSLHLPDYLDFAALDHSQQLLSRCGAGERRRRGPGRNRDHRHHQGAARARRTTPHTPALRDIRGLTTRTPYWGPDRPCRTNRYIGRFPDGGRVVVLLELNLHQADPNRQVELAC